MDGSLPVDPLPPLRPFVYNPSGASSLGVKALPKRDEIEVDADTESLLTEMSDTLQGLSEWREKRKHNRAKVQARFDKQEQEDRQKCTDDIDCDEGEEMMTQQLERLRAQRERIEQRSEKSIFSCGPSHTSLYVDSSEMAQLSKVSDQAEKDMDKLKRDLMDLKVKEAALDSMIALAGPETTEDCPADDMGNCQDLGNDLLDYGSELDALFKKMDQAAEPAEEKRATTAEVAVKCKTKPPMVGGKENEPEASVFVTQSAPVSGEELGL
jgi:hypothetical protein